MSEAYRVALATMRRVQTGLVTAATPEERAQLLDLHEQTLQLLEQSAHDRRLTTAAQARRFATLDLQLATTPAGERGAIIRNRLGLSKSRYYEIREYMRSPDQTGLQRALMTP